MGLLFIAALVCTTRQVLVLIVVLSSTIMEKIGRIAHVSRQFLLYFLCYATNYILPILVRVEQNCHVSPIQCMTVHQIKRV